jgi:hypothetical protein
MTMLNAYTPQEHARALGRLLEDLQRLDEAPRDVGAIAPGADSERVFRIRPIDVARSLEDSSLPGSLAPLG